MSVGSSEGWSQHSSTYAEHVFDFTVQFNGVLNAALRAEMQKREGAVTVLDVAAGPGFGSVELARRCPTATVIASDFAPGMVALCAANIAKAGLGNVTARVENALALSLESASVHFVVSNFGVGILREPEMSLAVAEALRVVKPGGMVLFTVWSMDRDVGALHAHKTMFKAFQIARGVADVDKVPLGDTEASLRDKFAALPGVKDVRVADARGTFVVRVADLARVLVENPAFGTLLGPLSSDDRAVLTESVSKALMSLTGAKSPDETLFMGSSANLVMLTKE
jgi:ubiquinone/menaquinone biosynthesis C-methylase UbiE